jgi:hypothetical protein
VYWTRSLEDIISFRVRDIIVALADVIAGARDHELQNLAGFPKFMGLLKELYSDELKPLLAAEGPNGAAGCLLEDLGIMAIPPLLAAPSDPAPTAPRKAADGELPADATVADIRAVMAASGIRQGDLLQLLPGWTRTKVSATLKGAGSRRKAHVELPQLRSAVQSVLCARKLGDRLTGM